MKLLNLLKQSIQINILHNILIFIIFVWCNQTTGMNFKVTKKLKLCYWHRNYKYNSPLRVSNLNDSSNKEGKAV